MSEEQARFSDKEVEAMRRRLAKRWRQPLSKVTHYEAKHYFMLERRNQAALAEESRVEMGITRGPDEHYKEAIPQSAGTIVMSDTLERVREWLTSWQDTYTERDASDLEPETWHRLFREGWEHLAAAEQEIAALEAALKDAEAKNERLQEFENWVLDKAEHGPGCFTAVTDCICGLAALQGERVMGITRGPDEHYKPGPDFVPMASDPELLRQVIKAQAAEIERLRFAAKQALMALEEGYDAPKIHDDLKNALQGGDDE